MAAARPLEDRFHEKYERIPECGCWIWTATTDGHYGLISVGRKMEKAHRVSYDLHNGPIPDGLCVMHRCDVTECVNPYHLMAGSQIENIADRDAKGRQVPNRPAGELNGMAKLTKDKVVLIKEMLGRGDAIKVIASEFEVSRAAVSLIKSGKRWANI